MTDNVKETTKYHTDAVYRCRITSEKKNYYLLRLAAVLKNNGDRKTLFIPRNEMYLNKDMIQDELKPGDYLSLKLEASGRRTNIKEVLHIDKIERVQKKDVAEKKNNQEKVELQKQRPNPFAVLMDSDSDDE